MKNVIITKQTTVEEALAGNGVLMVGRIPNKNEYEGKLATSGKRLAMYGKLPNKRDLGMVEVIEVEPAKVAVEDVVEIPKFLVRAQEEQRIERIMRERRAKRKKASSKKPLLQNIVEHIFNAL